MTMLPLANALDLPVQAGRPVGEGWVAAAGLLDPGSPVLEERVRAFGDRIGAERRAVAASLLLEAYAGLVASVAFGWLVGAGHVPDLAAANVSMRFPPGQVPDSLAVHDPSPGGGDGQDRLAQLHRVAPGLLDGHLGVLVACLEDLRLGRGPRALWGTGRQRLRRRDRAGRRARRLVAAAGTRARRGVLRPARLAALAGGDG